MASITEERTIRLCPCTWGIVAVMTGILVAGVGCGVVKRTHTKPKCDQFSSAEAEPTPWVSRAGRGEIRLAA